MAQAISNSLSPVFGNTAASTSKTAPIKGFAPTKPSLAKPKMATDLVRKDSILYPARNAPFASFSSPKSQIAPLQSLPPEPQTNVSFNSIPVQGLVKPNITAGQPFQQNPQPTFPGVATSLIEASQRGSPAIPSAVGGLLQSGSQRPAEEGGGYKVYSDALKRQQDVLNRQAQEIKGIETGGMDLTYQVGRKAAIERAMASEREAAAQAVTQAQTAINQSLEQQRNQQAGFQQAGGLANTAQQNVQQGLTSALGQIAPSGNYPFVFSPLTGAFSNAGGGGVISAQEAAQAVNQGQMTYDQAKQALGYLGGTGEAQLQQAILQGGGNPLALQASGAASQQNIGTQATAQTEIARQGLQSATNDYVNMTSAANYAKSQSGAIVEILDKTGLNNLASSDANKAINKVLARFSDPDRVAFETALRDARLAYSNLLSSGGTTPTENDANSIATLDMNSSAAAIASSIQQLDASIARRLQAQYGAMQTYQQSLNAPQQAQTSYAQPTGNSIWSW